LPGSTGTAPAQNSFLPSSDPGTLIFLSWDTATFDDLLDVLELSKPKLIVDMRVSPRFNIGQLTRRRFFELLRELKCQYVDLFGRMGIENVSDALTNPMLVATQTAKFIERLPVPNSGPLVFLHDNDLMNDAYVSALAQSLPSRVASGWQVFRQGSRDANTIKHPIAPTAPAESRVSTTIPLIRDTVFISHATPNDNAFAIWLASKLTSAGYNVWCDVNNLSGGDVFWRNIENVIRSRAAKFVLVQSEHMRHKVGTHKEAYLALKVAERNGLKRFIIPMRIDATPFDDTLIELIDIQAIDCRRDWLTGLKGLMGLLQRDGVPRTESSKSDQFSGLISKFGTPAQVLKQSNEPLISNLLQIVSPPEHINFFSCSGIPSNQLPLIAARLSVPAFAYYTHIATLATRERFIDSLASIDLETHVGERASLSWSNFLAGNSGDLPAWNRISARHYAFGLLHKAWGHHLARRGATMGQLANNRPFWFFTSQHVADNKVRFSDFSGRAIRRQLVGFSAKRRVYWHFSIHARCFVAYEQYFFAATPHVTFSSDGRAPLASKAQLHVLRRSFCRSWWNDRWRDLMRGFVSTLADNDAINLDIGSTSAIGVDAHFKQFISPVSLVSRNDAPSIGDAPSDEDIEDLWDDDMVDDEHDSTEEMSRMSVPGPGDT
jgi:hypothetical protein